MNEDQLQETGRQLEFSIKASLGLRAQVSRRLRANRKRTGRIKVAIGAMAMCAIAGGVLLAPRAANGAMVTQMLGALKDAKSMQVTMYLYGPLGGRQKATVITQAEGMRRYQIHIGTPLERVHLSREGLIWNYDPIRKLATFEPSNEHAEAPQSALEYVEEFTNLGLDGPRFSKIVPGPLHAGRRTYRIIYDKPEDHYHAEILVDKESNLPISDAIRTREQSIDDDYAFNFAPDSSQFDPNFGGDCRVVNIPKEVEQWRKKHAKPVEAISDQDDDFRVADIQQNTEGAVFVVYTSTSKTSVPLIPLVLVDDKGTGYLKVRDYNPGNTFSASWAAQDFRWQGALPIIAVFVPIEPVSHSHNFELGLARSTDSIPIEPGTAPAATIRTLKLTVDKTFSGELPDYATYFKLDDYHNAIGLQERSTRAQFFEKQGNMPKAEQWYAEAAACCEKTSEVRAVYYFEKQAACLREMGRNGEADTISAKADKFRLLDRRIHKSLDMPIPF